MWLVRRATLEVTRPARAGERLAIRTWVEDFRRVRSHRRYAVQGADGTPVLEALTDWVYVGVESGRPRRVPRELETAFAFAAGAGGEREPWSAPPAPPAPALGTHRVRACEVDSIGHVNNAVYLDLATQAVLDAIEDTGWSLDRMLAEGSVPVLARADLEYLEGARYGDQLGISTWFAWAPAALDAHQRIARAGGERPPSDGGHHDARGPRGRGHGSVVRHRSRGGRAAGRRRRARRARRPPRRAARGGRGSDPRRRRRGRGRRHRPARRGAGRAAHRRRRRSPRAPRRARQQCGGRPHPSRRRGPQRGVAGRPRDQRPRHAGRVPPGAPAPAPARRGRHRQHDLGLGPRGLAVPRRLRGLQGRGAHALARAARGSGGAGQ